MLGGGAYTKVVSGRLALSEIYRALEPISELQTVTAPLSEINQYLDLSKNLLFPSKAEG